MGRIEQGTVLTSTYTPNCTSNYNTRHMVAISRRGNPPPPNSSQTLSRFGRLSTLTPIRIALRALHRQILGALQHICARITIRRHHVGWVRLEASVLAATFEIAEVLPGGFKTTLELRISDPRIVEGGHVNQGFVELANHDL